MGYPRRHTHPLPQLRRVLSVNTPRVAHSFIHAALVCSLTLLPRSAGIIGVVVAVRDH
jgi:hypothetical protein